MRGHFRLMLSVLLVAVWMAPAASAAPSRPPGAVPSYITEQVAGSHFIVHYTSNSANPGSVSSTDAGTLLSNAENAYSYEVGQWGYPPPKDDGDGKTDIYVVDSSVIGGMAAQVRADDTGAQTTAYMFMSSASVVNGFVVAHEFFHEIQFGIYDEGAEGFLAESTAEWAGQAVAALPPMNGTPPPEWYPKPGVPIDCTGSSCADTDADGYRASIFFEYLSERFGMGFVHEVWDREAALGAAAGGHQQHNMQALSDVLAAHGSSVADAFNGFVLAAMAGRITRPGVLPNLPAASQMFTVSFAGGFAPHTETVDHLAIVREMYRGDEPNSSAPCDPMTMRFHIDLPPGVPTQPFFVVYPASGQPPATAVYPLTVTGNVASGDVPWATCASEVASLVLPNASTTADGQTFSVQFTVIAPPPPPPPSNQFTFSTAIGRQGAITILVHPAGAGRLSVRATTKVSVKSSGHHKTKPKSRTILYGTASARVRGTAANRLKLSPTVAAKKWLQSERHLVVSITISFRPNGGSTRSKNTRLTVRYKAATKAPR